MTLLIPVAAAPWITPMIHKNMKIAAAKMTMSMTSLFTAISTFCLDDFAGAFFPRRFDEVFLVPLDVFFLVLLFVFVLLLDVLFPDADAIILLPLNEFYMIL